MTDDVEIGLENTFRYYAKLGNAKSDGTTLALANIDKWMTDAGIFEGKKLTTNDTANCFKKLNVRALSLSNFMTFLDMLAKEKKLNLDNLKETLANSQVKQTANAATSAKPDSNKPSEKHVAHK